MLFGSIGKKIKIHTKLRLIEVQSFLLAATIEEHQKGYEDDYPTKVAYVRQSLYVDDVTNSGCMAEEAKYLKEAKCELHKWHSNVQ